MSASKYGNARSRKRRRRKHTGRIFGILLGFVLIVAAFTAITIFFKVSDVVVVGESRYTSDEIIELSGIEKGDNLFLINKFAAIDRIFDKLYYLDEIRMRRHLPGTIEITVTECVPIAAIQKDGGYLIVDIKGKILEENALADEGRLTIVKGAQIGDSEIGHRIVLSDENQDSILFELLNKLQSDDILKNIQEIDITKLYEIKFMYQDRFKVMFGMPEEIEKKIKFLKYVVEEKLASNETGTIDITDASTVRFIPGDTD